MRSTPGCRRCTDFIKSAGNGEIRPSCNDDINTEPEAQDQATPQVLQATLISEVDRWAPIIKAAGQFAD